MEFPAGPQEEHLALVVTSLPPDASAIREQGVFNAVSFSLLLIAVTLASETQTLPEKLKSHNNLRGERVGILGLIMS